MASIQVVDVSKCFRLYKDRPGSVKEMFTKFGKKRYEDFWALRDVNLEVRDGTVHGLIGHNGCGKSTLLRMMAGIHIPTSGKVITDGRLSALLELGAGFHPELTGRENVYLNASILGLSRKQTDAIFDRIVEFSGLEPFIDSPVKHYSSGMFVRLGFSVAVHVDPEILLIDEVIAVGDEEFQRRCLDHLASLKASGVTIVLVTHSLGVVQNMCDHVTWIDHGRVRAEGDALTVVADYLHEVNEEESDRATGETPAVPVGDGIIESVEFLDATSAAIPFAVSSDPLTIRVNWRAGVAPEPPEFVLAIESESGVHLGSTRATASTGENGGSGGRVLDYRFEHLPLAAGNYTVRVEVNVSSSRVPFGRTGDLPLQVRAGGRIIEGMFELPGSWRLDQ
jgi:lipopolysaccharide transport system ATP-binding protein